MQRRTPLHNKDNAKGTNVARARDDSGKKGGNASATGGMEGGKRSSMDGLAQDHEKDGAAPEKATEGKDEGHNNQLSSGVVSSSQDEAGPSKRPLYEDGDAEAEEDGNKKKKRKDNEEKEPMAKPAAPVARGSTGRILTGTKPPGPASKTGATPLGKSASQGSSKGSSVSSNKNTQASQKGSGSGGKASSQGAHQGKSSGGGKGSSHSSAKPDRKSPVASPKPSQAKDDDDEKSESSEPKVPPLKIVIPGGAGGAAGRSDQEGEGGSGQRGSGKGRGGCATLPYVIPCTSTDAGQASDSSDGNSDDKRSGEGGGGKTAVRVLRSHRATDDKGDKERASPQTGPSALHANKSPPPAAQGCDHDHPTSTVSSSSTSSRSDSGAQGASVELHPRKRKIKASKDSHRGDPPKSAVDTIAENTPNIANSNPYQMYLHIKKQIDRRQKSLFPVKPKPPKDFNKYLMNRCTYTLQGNVNPEPQIELPPSLPPQMKEEFLAQEKERHRVRVQHLVEKEKLVLAVEQEILRVHGRAERAVANQALPFSVCTILRDSEVYNVLAPEQEEKRNAQRSRCNGRQINSWLQEVDDKWEKIKEGTLRRQHTEAEALHAVQHMSWEWRLKELGLCDYKTTPRIDPTHVPQLHVANFDLPA
ncbi:ankyrin repeat domain-containing protein 11 isoform X3 [Plutella xylostella]|uniref:ankyrin repeat domain-containing protein 11 isoform X3 n=1 Tax=Plutella xylostella TaxID=51655 RepID=UPI0020324906|nr:ankyrin repeat domain-containing protein 11 isoform X3 [Plutella xylostella]